MSRRIILVASMLAMLGSLRPVSAEIIDRIVAVVDNTFIITLSDIQKERTIQKAIGNNPGDDDSLVDTLIEKHLIEGQIALFREIDIDDADVNERLRGVQIPGGITLDELRVAVQSELRRYEFTVQRFRPLIQASDDELRQYFQTVIVPALQQRGAPIPPVEQGMLDARPLVLAEKMNKEADDWLNDLKRRTTIEKTLK